MRVADVIGDYLIANVATDYLPAPMWDEDKYPFDQRTAKILVTRQSGRPVDAFTRQIDVDVIMFCRANADTQDLNDLFNDVEATLEYIKANFVINDDIRPTITQDVTGPYHTDQGRFYYRFAMLTFSE